MVWHGVAGILDPKIHVLRIVVLGSPSGGFHGLVCHVSGSHYGVMRALMSNETVKYFQTKLGAVEMVLMWIGSFEVINCFFFYLFVCSFDVMSFGERECTSDFTWFTLKLETILNYHILQTAQNIDEPLALRKGPVGAIYCLCKCSSKALSVVFNHKVHRQTQKLHRSESMTVCPRR